MKVPMKIFRIVTTSFTLLFALFLLTSCGGRPVREGSQLTLGPGADGLSFEEQGMGDFGDDGLFGDPDSGLALRDGLFAEGDQVRGLLEPVFFEFDRSAITPDQQGRAMDAVSFMESNPEVGMILEGHCDWRGTTEYNMGLGDRRATSIYNFMVDQGISPNRLEVLSRGDLEATVGGSESEMAFDRRVEFVVVQQ